MGAKFCCGNEEPQHSEVCLEDDKIAKLQPFIRSIIKFQALFRGYMVRKQYPNLAVKINKTGHFASNDERGPDNANAKKGERYFQEHYVFKNGAVYRGEWLDNMRDGYGV